MKTIRAGDLRHRISIERLLVEKDDYGGEGDRWSELARVSAQLFNGTGQERRAAAQELATAASTFRVRRSDVTYDVTPKDRIFFDGFIWDIVSIAPIGLNEGLEITAVAAMGARTMRVRGSVAAIANLAAGLAARAQLDGGAAAAGAAAGELSGYAQLQALLEPAAALGGPLAASARLSGSSAAAAELAAQLSGTAHLAGAPASAATLTGGLGPFNGYDLALDFKNGIYRQSGLVTTSLSSLAGYTYSRSGAKSELDLAGTGLVAFAANVPGIVPGKGYWARPAFINLLLNAGSSSNLVTQDVTVAAVANTLSFIGTGTVTLSGVSTAGPLVGTGANNRVTLTFTPTAGTLTLTVTGTVQYAGLVASIQPGPIIATAGSTATVATDNLRVTSPVTASEDFIMMAVANFQASNGGSDDNLASLVGSTTNDRIQLYRASGSGDFRLRVTATTAQISLAPWGGGAVVSGRLAGLVRVRGNKFTIAGKRSDGVIFIGTESGVVSFPAITKAWPGSLNGGSNGNCPVEGMFMRRGTFADADLTAILTAA